MTKKLILPVLILLLVFLPLCTCTAVSIGDLFDEESLIPETTDEPDSSTGLTLADYQTDKEGILSGKVLGFERNILFNYHPAENSSSDFLLIGFASSGMKRWIPITSSISRLPTKSPTGRRKKARRLRKPIPPWSWM